MKSRLTLVLSACSLLFVAGEAAAQDEFLVVERKQDQFGRERVLAKLKKTHIKQMLLLDANPDEIVAYLGAATGGKVGFLFVSRGIKKDEVPKLTLKLRSISLASAMAVIEMQTELRFVYRAGTVMLRPKDEVKELTYLQFYDVRAATFRVPNFPAPKLGLGRGEGALDIPEETEGSPISGFDADQLVDMIRTHVSADAWGEKASITQMRGVLAVRHTLAGHKKVRKFLAKVGAAQSAPRRGRAAERPAVRPKKTKQPAKNAKKAAKSK